MQPDSLADICPDLLGARVLAPGEPLIGFGVYVYVFDPVLDADGYLLDGVPRYVGKGSTNRPWQHVDNLAHAPRRGANRAWIEALRNQKQYVVAALDGLTESDAFALERAMIDFIGRVAFDGCLLNVQEGGIGFSSADVTSTWAKPEFRKTMAAALKRRSADPVYRAHLAERGKRNSADPVWRAKVTASNRQNAADPVWRAKLAEAFSKVKGTPEYRASRIAGAQKRAADPIYRAKNAEILRKRNADPAFQAVIAAKNRRQAADPAWRAAHAEAICERVGNPAWQAKCVEAARKRNADPVYRAKNAENMRRNNARMEADAEYRARRAERLRKRNADPEFQARAHAARRAKQAAKIAALTAAPQLTTKT